MPIYKFKEKGPAYGLAYTEGELVALDDKKPVVAACLVPEVTKDNKGNMVNTGRQIIANKEYSIDFLIESGVIVPASAEDKKAYESKQDINSQADVSAEQNAAAEKESRKAKAKKIGEE